MFLIKTDHQLASAHRLTLRYNHQNFNGQNFENGGANMSEQHTGNSNVYTRTLNASLTSVLGSRLFNEVRFQFARDREPGFANSDVPEANIRSGGTLVLTIGRNSFSPRETTIKRWQVADTVTWARGAHKLKGGFDFQFDDILNFFPGNFGGSYTFNSLASFNAGTPNLVTGEQYVQAFEGPGTTGPTTNPNIQEYSFFAQDEWRLRPDLTLNLGVRYDVMKTAKPDTRNPDRGSRRRRHRHQPPGRRHQQHRSAPRPGVEPGRQEVRGARRLRHLLRPHAVDHAGHGALEQRHQRPHLHVHGRVGADVSESLHQHSDGRRGAAAEHSGRRQGLPESAPAAGERRRRLRGDGEHVAVGQLSVREGRFTPALDRSQPRAARLGDLHGGGLERDASRITASARRRRGRSRTSTA